ncbi:cytochrome P450 3A24-like [Oppia nitens]|uniref:cytochrome P450 3A24-like n=1 Tax=Oppia nitens TaxID=1686743 RepID=UPI0023DC0688|nr:cytochrome P450 3A24-like [Oppia nitens]
MYWESQGIQTASVGLWAQYRKPLQELEIDLYRRYGKCFGYYEMSKPVLYLSDPVLIRDVLVKDFHSFANKRSSGNGSDPLTDNMVANLNGENWKRVRSLITPAFSTKKLKQMLPLIDECLETMDKNLRTMSADNGSSRDGSDMKRLFGAYSMEVIIQVAFGVKVDALFDEDNPIIRNVQSFFSQDLNLKILVMLAMPSLAGWLGLTFFDPKATKFFQDFTQQIIDERRRHHELKTGDNHSNNNHQKRVDFLQIMLDSMMTTTTDDTDITGKTDGIDTNLMGKFVDENVSPKKSIDKILTNNELQSQCLLFFIAGYETTATTLSILAYLLAKNPVVQEKLFNEVDQYFKHDSQKDNDYDILLHSLKYLDAVIMESMRLYPFTPYLEREASDDYQLRTGIQIRKGQLVHIPSYAMHRDDQLFPDADQFQPERFLAPANTKHNQYVYLPFGIGPRICLGVRLAEIEAKLGLAYAVHKYRFHDTGKPMEFYYNSGVMQTKKIMVRVEKRA